MPPHQRARCLSLTDIGPNVNLSSCPGFRVSGTPAGSPGDRPFALRSVLPAHGLWGRIGPWGRPRCRWLPLPAAPCRPAGATPRHSSPSGPSSKQRGRRFDSCPGRHDKPLHGSNLSICVTWFSPRSAHQYSQTTAKRRYALVGGIATGAGRTKAGEESDRDAPPTPTRLVLGPARASRAEPVRRGSSSERTLGDFLQLPLLEDERTFAWSKTLTNPTNGSALRVRHATEFAEPTGERVGSTPRSWRRSACEARAPRRSEPQHGLPR